MLNGNRSIPYLCRFKLTLPAITIGIMPGGHRIGLKISLSLFFLSLPLCHPIFHCLAFRLFVIVSERTNVDTVYLVFDLEPRSRRTQYVRADCVTSLSCVTGLWECGCPWFPADFHITNAKLACAWRGCPKQIRPLKFQLSPSYRHYRRAVILLSFRGKSVCGFQSLGLDPTWRLYPRKCSELFSVQPNSCLRTITCVQYDWKPDLEQFV